jgi:hypothetical protein
MYHNFESVGSGAVGSWRGDEEPHERPQNLTIG